MTKSIKIKDLVPDDANFNTGTEFGNSLIDKSLSKFGAGRSILIDKNNRIIAGNKTIENAAANGFNDVVIVETTGDQIVAVKRTDIDLNTKKGREMALADNATAKANISWDAQALTDWDMPTVEWGIDLAEFAVEEVGEADAEPQIDKAAELNKKWKVKSGDLWQIGEHRLLCGDSTKREDVERATKVTIDVVFADPPYGIAHSGKGIDGATHGNDFGSIANDDDVSVAVDAFLLCQKMFQSASQVWWGANYYPSVLPNGCGWVVWDKQREGEVFSGAELAFNNKGVRVDVFRHQWHGMIKASEQGESRVHPTQKPVELVRWCVGDGQRLFDPFAGSGTTLVACQNLNRKCYAIEISENYCAVILERMATAFPDIEIKRIDG